MGLKGYIHTPFAHKGGQTSSCLLSALQAKDASSIADIVVPVIPEFSLLLSSLPIIPIIIQSFTAGVT